MSGKKARPKTCVNTRLHKKPRRQHDLRNFFTAKHEGEGDEKQAYEANTAGLAAHGGDEISERNKAAWKRVFDKTKLPVCRGHTEPCVVREVKKKGPNHGRFFFVCARADGPAPWGRCQHFRWCSEHSWK